MTSSHQKQITVELPVPHSAQQQVLRESKRFNVVCCGRRWGKSTLGIDRLIEPALRGLPCAWFAPSYRNLGESWRAIQSTLNPVIAARNNADFRLELIGGGVIECWSLDSDVSDFVRGRKYARVVADEAALIRDLLNVWETTIRPTLTDYRGDAWFLSTPRGINDFHTLFMRGQDPERSEWRSWQMPTITNPYISADEIECARKDITEAAFNQEYLGLFQAFEGAVFRKVQEAATADPYYRAIPGHTYVVDAIGGDRETTRASRSSTLPRGQWWRWIEATVSITRFSEAGCRPLISVGGLR